MKRLAATTGSLTVSFLAGAYAAKRLARILRTLDRGRTEYALAGVMLEEAWVSQR